MDLYTYRAVCTRVVDGDTVDLQLSLGFNVFMQERVRILGIDTSEIYGVKRGSEEYNKGMLSKVRVEELVMGKDLTVVTHKDKKGKYGRYLAEIFVDDVNVGDLLIKEGLAQKYEG